jgi:protein SCO1/2
MLRAEALAAMTKKRNALIVFLLAVPHAMLVILGLRSRVRAQSHQLASGVFDPPRDAPEFELDGSLGKKIHLHDYLGKVVVLEVWLHVLPNGLPRDVGHLMEVHRQLGSAANDVQVLFVTVDPERDSPQRLREFLGAFTRVSLAQPARTKHSRTCRGRTGSPRSGSHLRPDRTLLVPLSHRPRGKIRALVPFNRPVDEIAQRRSHSSRLMKRARWIQLAGVVLVALLAVTAAAAFVPVSSPSREERSRSRTALGTPDGWREARDPPSEIHLVLGVRDVLVLRNLDDVPQQFGPTI